MEGRSIAQASNLARRLDEATDSRLTGQRWFNGGMAYKRPGADQLHIPRKVLLEALRRALDLNSVLS
jgi:hypothetical protein